MIMIKYTIKLRNCVSRWRNRVASPLDVHLVLWFPISLWYFENKQSKMDMDKWKFTVTQWYSNTTNVYFLLKSTFYYFITEKQAESHEQARCAMWWQCTERETYILHKITPNKLKPNSKQIRKYVYNEKQMDAHWCGEWEIHQHCEPDFKLKIWIYSSSSISINNNKKLKDIFTQITKLK